MSEEKLEAQKNKARATLDTMLGYLGLEATLRVEEKNNRLAIKISSSEAGRIIGRKGQTLESLQLLLNRIMFKGEEDCPRIVLDIDGYGRDGNNGPRGEAAGEGSEAADSEDRGAHRGRNDRRDRGERGGRDRRDRGERVDRGDRGDRCGDRGGERNVVSEEQLEQQALDAAKEVKRWGDPVTLPKMNAHDRRIIHITLQDDPELTTESEGEGALKKVVIALKKND